MVQQYKDLEARAMKLSREPLNGDFQERVKVYSKLDSLKNDESTQEQIMDYANAREGFEGYSAIAGGLLVLSAALFTPIVTKRVSLYSHN